MIPEEITLTVTESDLLAAVEVFKVQPRRAGVSICTHCTIAQALLRQVAGVRACDVKLSEIHIKWQEPQDSRWAYYQVEAAQDSQMRVLTTPTTRDFNSEEMVKSMRAVLPLTLNFKRNDNCGES